MLKKKGDFMQVIQTKFNYTSQLIPLNPSNVKYIIIHHAESVNASPEEIHKWHLNNGWSGFGYNEYIRKDGTVYIGRGMNIGAQCHGMNSVSYGICLEGNFTMEKPTIEQMKSLVRRIYSLKPSFPNFLSVEPHNKFTNTLCPAKGFSFDELNGYMTFYNSLMKLKNKGFINSPDYWFNNENYDVRYVRALINNFSK